MAGATILIVDDDARLRSLVSDYLTGYGYKVVTRADGEHLENVLQEIGPDLVILDIMMPGRDGLTLLGELRRQNSVPVIMLTAKGDDADRIVGLELGADDYLPKPFNPRELLARIKAVLRRSAGMDEPDRPEPSSVGLQLDQAGRRLLVDGDPVEVSATEYKIMEALISRPETVFSRDNLLNLSRGRDHEAFDRSVDVHVSNLRAKLKPYPHHSGRIKTVWGQGYMLVGES